MNIKTEDLKNVLTEIAQKDIIDKMPISGDIRNPLRIFLITCFVKDTMSRKIDAMAVDGIVHLPDEKTAMEAIEASGGTIPFPVELPMGMGFTFKFNKSDLEHFYTNAKKYQVSE